MTPQDSRAQHELEFLVEILRRERRKPRRAMIIDDFAARAAQMTPARAALIDLLTKGALSLDAADAATLLHEYLQIPLPSTDRHSVDVLIVCVKPVERTAILTALGRPESAGSAGDRQGDSGREYFDGVIASRVAGRELSYRLVAMNEQGNKRAAIEMHQILAECAPKLAVLIGMAAGPTKLNAGDVVACELVLDAGPGTRRDGKRIREPDPVEPARRIVNQVKANTPQINGWYERLASAVATAEAADIDIPRRGSATPDFSSGAIVSDEEKDETTTLDEWLEAYSGDAKAYDMESAGFGSVCDRHRGVFDWMVFRGISDFGASTDSDSEVRRPKDMQIWATMSAATCFLTWLTEQTSFFGTEGEH